MARNSRSASPLHILIVLAVAGAALFRFGGAYLQKPVVPGQVEVFFSPSGGCTDEVVKELRHAQRSVLVQAYFLTSQQIAEALIDAHRRGLEVKVIIDRKALQEQPKEAEHLAHAGVPVWIDGQHPIAHNKVMILDGDTVITGSFNFTRQAETSNAENLVVMHKSLALGEEYSNNWRQHLGHSEPYHP